MGSLQKGEVYKGKYWEFIVEDLMEQIPIWEKMKQPLDFSYYTQ